MSEVLAGFLIVYLFLLIDVWRLSYLFPYDELLDQRFQAALVGGILFATWCLVRGFVPYIVQLVEIGVICTLKLLGELVLTYGSGFVILRAGLCLIL